MRSQHLRSQVLFTVVEELFGCCACWNSNKENCRGWQKEIWGFRSCKWPGAQQCSDAQLMLEVMLSDISSTKWMQNQLVIHWILVTQNWLLECELYSKAILIHPGLWCCPTPMQADHTKPRLCIWQGWLISQTNYWFLIEIYAVIIMI